jgi:hypothetical protein
MGCTSLARAWHMPGICQAKFPIHNRKDNFTKIPLSAPPMRKRNIFILALLVFSSAFTSNSQPRVLDDFETLEGWHTITSEGAKLSLLNGEGKSGKALEMEFDLSGVYGYVIAEKDFTFDVPPDYQFTFDLRGDTPVNNFEFKLIDDKENVFWIKKLMVEYPKVWTRQRIRKGQLTFAWGPARQDEIHTVRKIQFVVSVGTGGAGMVYIDNFRFEPIDDEAAKNARATVVTSSSSGSISPQIDAPGNLLSEWHSSGTSQSDSLTIDFHRLRDVGGLVIDWDSSDYATAYNVLLSDDGKEWSTTYSVTKGNGGRDYLSMKEGEGRMLKLSLIRSSRNRGYGLRRMEIKGRDLSNSPNDFYRVLAADAPVGYYPQYLLSRQSYWTIVGVNGDTKEALLNEQGQLEVDKLRFSLEPFLYVDGKLVTWNDVTRRPSLMDGYLPIPSVTWDYSDVLSLTVQAVAAGAPGKSLLGVRYRVEAHRSYRNVKLLVAIRPFQVNPPWQQLNTEGGVSRIDSITYSGGNIQVDDKQVIPVTPPSAFGAAEFDQGDIAEYLSRGTVPTTSEARDHFRHASAALRYDIKLESGEVKDIIIVVPFHDPVTSPTPNMGPGEPETYYQLMLSQTARDWSSLLNKIKIDLPASAQAVVRTVKSNLAYIFINRDGPGIQPGSRSYERSWIRDGSLTCAALLRTGNSQAVREFLDWYAKGQFPSGKIPCVMDSRGPDAVPEHDSNGEFIYAILQYYLFTKDTAWLRGKFDAVTKTVRYIQSLRAERKTAAYKNGTPEQRACYGLVPESISHEGYWDVPRHSYWDDFFILRGLKDATSIARVLGEKALEREFAAERDDFRKDLYASMRLAMRNKKIDYIPGCAELGDFDATSTTIGVYPGGELGNIPEPQLHNTFDKYYEFFVYREQKNNYVNYTPYETRAIGTFVQLGEKERAEHALNFFVNDRRPPAWNQWAEVVWRDPATPKFIGDMPHTWVGSDFIRSVLSLFVMEREKDDAHVLAAAIPDAWVKDSAGVRVAGLPTYFGNVNYTIHSSGNSVVAEISGSFDAAHHKLAMASPLSARVCSVRVNGKKVAVGKTGEVVIRTLPTKVEFWY